MRRVEFRIFVHATDEPLPAALIGEPQVGENFVQTSEYGSVKFVVVAT